jgi:DNA-binding XRE family transcriptional regulator
MCGSLANYERTLVFGLRLGDRTLIANERRYRIAKAALRRFEDAVVEQRRSKPGKNVHPRIHKATGDALESEVEVLSDQIQRYERLRDGCFKERELDNLADLPIATIEARIAAGLTQKELAKRLGLHEQQIQRWEANLHSGVGVARLQEVIEALGMHVRGTVTYRAAA